MFLSLRLKSCHVQHVLQTVMFGMSVLRNSASAHVVACFISSKEHGGHFDPPLPPYRRVLARAMHLFAVRAAKAAVHLVRAVRRHS